MSVDEEIVNPSTNRPFRDVLNARVSRRKVMVGGLATAAVGFFGQSGIAQAGRGGQPGPNLPTPNQGPLVGFTPTENLGGPLPSVSDDYEYQVLIPWGTPLFSGVPDIAGGRPASSADQERQIGIGHDGMWFYPHPGANDHGVLCINHEFGRNTHVLGKGFPESLEDVRISQAAHGVSCVEIKDDAGNWVSLVDSPYNRRITPNTPVVFDGPVAGSALLDSTLGTAPAGTVNNCGNGYTPWGTYLTCEENFNGYFGAVDAYEPTEEQARYGFSANGFGYGWHVYDERWDLNKNAGEENRFGWIVEIDPRDPSAPPVKHTALGRFKHEGFAFATGRGGRAEKTSVRPHRNQCDQNQRHQPRRRQRLGRRIEVEDRSVYCPEVATTHDERDRQPEGPPPRTIGKIASDALGQGDGQSNNSHQGDHRQDSGENHEGLCIESGTQLSGPRVRQPVIPNIGSTHEDAVPSTKEGRGVSERLEKEHIGVVPVPDALRIEGVPAQVEEQKHEPNEHTHRHNNPGAAPPRLAGSTCLLSWDDVASHEPPHQPRDRDRCEPPPLPRHDGVTDNSRQNTQDRTEDKSNTE